MADEQHDQHGNVRRSDARRNRSAIVDAAAGELAREGDLSMRGVATAAGVSRSTLYRHFSTRAELELAVREDALVAARLAVENATEEDRPPLAALRRALAAIVDVAIERRLHVVEDHRPGRGGEQVGAALMPLADRLRIAAEVAPAPPRGWVRQATAHLAEACLGLSSEHPDDLRGAVDQLFHALTDPLDQGLVVLDPHGSLLAINPRGAHMLGVEGDVQIGEPLMEPSRDVVYEDGAPCPRSGYPLALAVQTGELQAGVRGHVGPDGPITWAAIEARPLRRPGTDSVYGVVGILSDITTEREWQRGQLRPAGELEGLHALPLDIVRTLDEIPPHLFSEQFVSEARRATGGPIALYALDIDGSHLLRVAGAEEFPDRLEAPLALGPELAEDGVPAMRARLESELPGVTMAPMWLRGRAVGILLAIRASDAALSELARLGAAAMELAGGYTDVFDAARRRMPTTPAAELQQSLLPPRIARIGGGELAGSVLPAYEVGGDWFDYVENRDGAWLAIADAMGKGPTAAALGGIGLAALRAGRRSDQSLESTVQTMHEAIHDVGRPEFFVTAIVGRWHAVYSTFSWINCGHPPPLVVRADGSVEQLLTESNLPLGLLERERRFSRHQRRLEDGERLILHSDGITARRTDAGLFGLDGIERAVRDAPGSSATALARSIQEAVMRASVDKLQDDAVAVVLVPTPDNSG